MDRAPEVMTDLEINKTIEIDDGMAEIRRVPGGFIYTTKYRHVHSSGLSITSCFVPYDEDLIKMTEMSKEMMEKAEGAIKEFKEFDSLPKG